MGSREKGTSFKSPVSSRKLEAKEEEVDKSLERLKEELLVELKIQVEI